jgi:hypothetical protein
LAVPAVVPEGELDVLEDRVELQLVRVEILPGVLPIDPDGLDGLELLGVVDGDGEGALLGVVDLHGGLGLSHRVPPLPELLCDPLEPLRHLIHTLLVLHNEAYNEVEDVGLRLRPNFVSHVISGSELADLYRFTKKY